MIRDISVPISSEFESSIVQPIAKRPWRLMIGPQIRNGTFLTAGAGSPDVFAEWGEAFTTTTISRDTTDYETDGASALFFDTNGANANATLFMAKDFDNEDFLANGDVIRYSFRSKIDTESRTMKIGGNITADQDLIAYPTINEWHTFTGEITIANGSTLFYFKRNNITSAKCWVDRIEVWRIR